VINAAACWEFFYDAITHAVKDRVVSLFPESVSVMAWKREFSNGKIYIQ
jgi:hypothetical protein